MAPRPTRRVILAVLSAVEIAPRRGLRREEAVHYVGVSPTKYDVMGSRRPHAETLADRRMRGAGHLKDRSNPRQPRQ